MNMRIDRNASIRFAMTIAPPAALSQRWVIQEGPVAWSSGKGDALQLRL